MLLMDQILNIITGMYLLGAVIWDLKGWLVPNRYILIGIAAGLLYVVFCGGSVGKSLLSFFTSIIILYPVYLVGGLGAGDIKLMAMLSVLYGVVFIAEIFVIALVCAAAYGAFKIMWDIYKGRNEKIHKIHFTIFILTAFAAEILRGQML